MLTRQSQSGALDTSLSLNGRHDACTYWIVVEEWSDFSLYGRRTQAILWLDETANRYRPITKKSNYFFHFLFHPTNIPSNTMVDIDLWWNIQGPFDFPFLILFLLSTTLCLLLLHACIPHHCSKFDQHSHKLQFWSFTLIISSTQYRVYQYHYPLHKN